ncbi:isopentenyl-diphosphate delta-isomerase [Puniceibacterium sp. IMCC21224]|uniref:isopentenyl-diphosphate Delta-isomerase n=1 Tax=Puniceibacterium sp. IMCC21224 TaxID=1618204 RepID=UPI00064DDE7D|nr:isopentenyl-diphosphate delta-isomerase [Puniceibacterium sp. IMCC21224]KMK65398.1 isopentenyl-diphosphate delta-isomerase [Puniceibacterium sp. IMCC21224]
MNIEIPAWVNGTLVPVDKLEAHVKGLRHKAVSVFVTRGTEILIQRRAMGKYHTPGLWANSCCTHPGWDEASQECAVRRMKEELGIVGLNPEYRDRVEYRADVGSGLIEHEVVDIFVAEAPAELHLDPDPSEVMETAWTTYPALLAAVIASPSDYTPWLRIYLDTYAIQIFSPQVLGRG